MVSIVLATYNGERYLNEQIDSILWQTYPNIELIVTDDLSTDGTREILEGYMSHHKNIHVYFNDENLGLIRNFEKTVQYAKGDYIAFADQDDVWLPEKIECLLEHIEGNMLVYSDSAYIDADGNLMGKKISTYRHLITGTNLYSLYSESGIWVAAHAMMFRRELLDLALPFSPYINHDMWMVYIAMLKGGVALAPDILTLYRQHGANMVGGLGCHGMMTNRPPDYSKAEAVKRKVGELDSLLSRAPETEPEFRDFLVKMRTYTANPSFINRIKRMALRLKYLNRIYAPRKRNTFRRIFKVIKTF
jgi:glycosyltransferase involved in cell wall biosynthesis